MAAPRTRPPTLMRRPTAASRRPSACARAPCAAAAAMAGRPPPARSPSAARRCAFPGTGVCGRADGSAVLTYIACRCVCWTTRWGLGRGFCSWNILLHTEETSCVSGVQVTLGRTLLPGTRVNWCAPPSRLYSLRLCMLAWLNVPVLPFAHCASSRCCGSHLAMALRFRGD